MRSLMIRITQQNFSENKIEKNEFGGACSSYGREERGRKGFGGET